MSTNDKVDLDSLRGYMLEQSFSHGYSRWNFHLRSLINWHRYKEIAVEVQGASSGGFVLDVGCGFGQITELLDARGVRAIGVDIGGEMKENRVWNHLKAAYVLGDACNLPFVSGVFDTVVCCGVLEHVYDASKFLDQCNRVLRTGGLFFCYYLPSSTGFEALFRKFFITDHVFYDKRLILRLLDEHGYRVIDVRREHLIPQPRHAIAIRIWNRIHRILLLLEGILVKTPLRFFGGNWRIRATKI